MDTVLHLPRTVRVFVPAMLLIIWLAVGAIGGPTFGKLSGIASNDQASYLPANAEATKVQNLQTAFVHEQKIPALVVVESDKQLSAQSFQQLARLRTQLAAVRGVSAADGLIGPIPSSDYKAAEYVIPLAETSKIRDSITSLRQTVSHNVPAGTSGYVTGPAGLAADLFSAFSGIDGILLYVALVAVFVILLAVYRSIILPFLVLLTAMFALSGAGLAVYHLVSADTLKLNSQSQGILSILAIGAATDYSLLIIARYREALEQHDKKWEAMIYALRTSIEPITASAATVIAGVLCLLVSDLNSNKDLGPIAALGIAFSYLAVMTLLPALLVIFGRFAFWPFRPKWLPERLQPTSFGTGLEDRKGLWRAVPRFIARRPRATWLVCFVVLAGVALAVPQFKASGIAQTDAILGHSDAVDGQHALERHFPAGTGSPAVIIASAAKLPAVVQVTASTPGVTAAVPFTGAAQPVSGLRPVVVDGKVMVSATLNVPADSPDARGIVGTLRTRVHQADPSALVGGVSAIELDTNDAAQTDLHRIIPLVLGVILVILMLLLRSVLAPVLLIGSVILSFTATIGISALLFNHVFHFAGSDAAIPLFGFIFLVALGVDYNIFLMTRVREESVRLGTKAGILRGLSVTGSVITSAGLVLAATFAALGVIPILFLVQIAFIVAFGVLLDTIVVRSLLVPAVCYDIGKAIWWPSKLWRQNKQ